MNNDIRSMPDEQRNRDVGGFIFNNNGCMIYNIFINGRQYLDT